MRHLYLPACIPYLGVVCVGVEPCGAPFHHMLSVACVVLLLSYVFALCAFISSMRALLPVLGVYELCLCGGGFIKLKPGSS